MNPPSPRTGSAMIAADFFVGDDSFESIFKMARAVKITRRIFQVVRAAIAIREWDAINLTWKGCESRLVGMRFAGERQRHHGAAMEGIFEGYDRRAFRIGARDFYRVLDGFGTSVKEDCLLWKLARRDLVHALREVDVAFVGRNLDAGVEEFFELSAHRIDYGLLAMAGVGAADASGEIDVAVAVDIFEPCIFGFRDIDRCAVRKAAGHGFAAALGERTGFGTGDGCVETNRTHISFS